MNLNLITYGIYLILIGAIIIKIGWVCYQNGNVFVAHLIPDDHEFCVRINKMLLAGYYLVNIGYSVIALSDWAVVNSNIQVIETIATHIATIICILAGLHYFNLFWITKFIKNNT